MNPEHLELPITGMTCASCANRIERKLNKLDGVTATVNYATEKATVDYDPKAVAPDQLVSTVEAAGYGAALPSSEPGDVEEDATAPLRRRLLLSAALSLPVLLLSAVPALQFDNWQWLVLNLATPVVLWGAWPDVARRLRRMSAVLSARWSCCSSGWGPQASSARALRRREPSSGSRVVCLTSGTARLRTARASAQASDALDSRVSADRTGSRSARVSDGRGAACPGARRWSPGQGEYGEFVAERPGGVLRDRAQRGTREAWCRRRRAGRLRRR
jgi:copper chaperone CopZ